MSALKRLGVGGVISLVAALALFFLMFLQWYEVGFTRESNLLYYISLFPTDHDAWHALGAISIVALLLVIALTIGATVTRLAGVDRKLGVMVCVGGGLAALVILYWIVSPPDLSGELEEWAWSGTLKLPIFLALAAALGIAIGGWWSMREEGGVGARHSHLESTP